MDFSLVIPSYNEAPNLAAFFQQAVACLDGEGLEYELIFVNDGSTDATMQILREAIGTYCAQGAGAGGEGSGGGIGAGRAGAGGAGGGRGAEGGACPGAEGASRLPGGSFTVIELSRNFGKEAALFAGLERAAGDYVCFIDADMQQMPSTALSMLRTLQNHPEFDSVAAVQEKRHEGLPIRLLKRVFYRVFNGMGETRLLTDASDFRVFTRQVARTLLSLHEQFRFSKGLFAWAGFKTYPYPYVAGERMAGKSKWPVRTLLSYAWNGILAFSTWPLRLVVYTGLITAILSIILLGIDAFDKIVLGNDTPGYQLVLYTTLLLGGVQLFVMGIFGEYMARAYIETKRRPVYVERSSYSLRPDRDTPAVRSAAAPMPDGPPPEAPARGAPVPEAPVPDG